MDLSLTKATYNKEGMKRTAPNGSKITLIVEATEINETIKKVLPTRVEKILKDENFLQNSGDNEKIMSDAAIAATFVSGTRKPQNRVSVTFKSLKQITDSTSRFTYSSRTSEKAAGGHEEAETEAETESPSNKDNDTDMISLPQPEIDDPETSFNSIDSRTLYGFLSLSLLAAEFTSILIAFVAILFFGSNLNPANEWARFSHTVDTFDLVAIRLPISILLNVVVTVLTNVAEKHLLKFNLIDCIKEAKECSLPILAYGFFIFSAASTLAPVLLGETGLFYSSREFMSGRI
ncbi:hypothetical protein HDU97_008171 [Phlyctochytrium planicorne]|nr:hypothetical protein HDU97_008171 [Phlyctochytrium planicorne]